MSSMTDWPTDRPGYPLRDCPPGLFMFEGTLCFRSEYSTTLENPRRYQPDAYVVESGEYFWGGAKTSEERSALIVFPVEPITPADLDAAVQAERVRAAKMLDDAASRHRTSAVKPSSIVESQAHELAAALLQLWANAIHMETDAPALDAALVQARREGMEAAAKIVAASGLNGPGYAAIILAAMAGTPKEYDYRDNTPHYMAAGSAIRSAAAREEGMP